VDTRTPAAILNGPLRAPALALALLLALFAGPALAQTATTLRPGDAIRVEIWREQDLSGEFLVAVDGTVTLPLLGRMRLVDIPVELIRDTLIAQYRVTLRNPSINVTPIRRVSVLGEVQKPGLYGADPTLSLAGVVALAGGSTANGNLNRIRIIRDGRVYREQVGAGETLSGADIRSGDQIVVEQRSWFARNTVFLVSAGLSLATSIATTIIITRP
jgi:protein involved in polysaccharide export with SLBB domain